MSRGSNSLGSNSMRPDRECYRRCPAQVWLCSGYRWPLCFQATKFAVQSIYSYKRLPHHCLHFLNGRIFCLLLSLPLILFLSTFASCPISMSVPITLLPRLANLLAISPLIPFFTTSILISFIFFSVPFPVHLVQSFSFLLLPSSFLTPVFTAFLAAPSSHTSHPTFSFALSQLMPLCLFCHLIINSFLHLLHFSLHLKLYNRVIYCRGDCRQCVARGVHRVPQTGLAHESFIMIYVSSPPSTKIASPKP